jgi:hypothetical protein
VIAVRRHAYIAARHLFARAVKADARDVVALTNYGVISFYLADLGEAQRTLDGARRLRKQILQQIPSSGRGDFEEERWARVTEPLDQIAARYLSRIADAESRQRAEALSLGDLTAALTLHKL